MLRRVVLTFFMALVLMCPCLASQAQGVERFTLDNGLRVTLWAIPTSDQVAVVTLFDIGERHDPPGQSGLAHLLEHLLITAATDRHPPTTYEELAAKSGNMFNAQTGDDYTLIATVVPTERLEEELAHGAARLTSLQVAATDLERELPRIEVELTNMRGGIPNLGLLNAARDAVAPLNEGALKGGVMEHIREIGLAEFRKRLADFYTANNTRLVVVGGFDRDAVRTSISELFAGVSRGKPSPEPPPRRTPDRAVRTLKGANGTFAPSICLAFAMPGRRDAHFASSVIIASRLNERFPMNQGAQGWTGAPVVWAPLDQPEALFVVLPIEPGETDDEALARVDALVREAAMSPVSPVDAFRASQRYGAILGATPLAPFIASQNPYFAALVLGRNDQLDAEGPQLLRRLREVNDESLRAGYDAVFSPSKRGASIWRPE